MKDYKNNVNFCKINDVAVVIYSTDLLEYK